MLAISRREFLAGLAGSSASLLIGASSVRAETLAQLLLDEPDALLFASARKQENGSYSIAILTDYGSEVASYPLPSRGHGVAYDPNTRKLVAFARRPDTFAVVIDLNQPDLPFTFHSASNRHFYGHGCFSPDGRLLYAAENDFTQARGVIGVYDISGAAPQRIGEFDSYGVGPHEILFSKNGRSLIVANGGIETHPEHGRDKLNLAHMQPSIAYIDPQNGDLQVKHQLSADLHQLSLRHMDEDNSGGLWVGAQYQGAPEERPPLIARFGIHEEAQLFDLPSSVSNSLQNYVGSVTVNNESSCVAFSCPRGGKVLYFDVLKKTYLGAQSISDGCGIAPIDENVFLISNGRGAIRYSDNPSNAPELLSLSAGSRWDNHMRALL
ncbi:DUF1513 domain-containing protein [Polycladidibacter stylochi]|uniref:DUF1513 domain-containing protein n=1 Tax=Polycladidibacter stylochi TaxID=1807766 RepID=UPI0008363CBF|nr:DUF1513 domain-containing protein [Pseudovibrio stylochi]